MYTHRLNKVVVAPYTPPTGRTWVNDADSATPRIDGKYVTAVEKRQMIRDLLEIPNDVWFDERLVTNNGFSLIAGTGVEGAYQSFDAYNEALKTLGEKYPVGYKATTWQGTHRDSHYDPVAFGFSIVMGYQTRFTDLLYESDGSGSNAGLKYKAKPLLVFQRNGINGQRSMTLRFASEKDLHGLKEDELKKLSDHSEKNPDYNVRLQDDISYARKLIDFYFREKAKNFQSAVEFYKEQNQRGGLGLSEGT